MSRKEPRRVVVAMNMPKFAARRKLEGIIDHIGRMRLHWEIQLVPFDRDFTRQTLEMARESRADGLILLNFPSRAIVRQVCESGIPTVIEGAGESGGGGRVAKLELDVRQLVHEAAMHFTDQHVFRSFGFVQQPEMYKWSVDRESAFRDEIQRQGLEFSSATSEPCVLKGWLRGLKKPAAVLAANDETARLVAQVARKAGISIPDDLALLGMDNDPQFCEKDAIDSIGLAFTEAGRLAAAALEQLMDGSTAPTDILWYGTSGIVSRGSSKSPKPAFGLVRKALAFIDAHVCDGIVVDDVVRHLQVSRRLVDLRFRETLGRTMLSCIQERRIAEVKRLLSDTDLPITAISGKIGIANANHLKNVFKRETGTSMQEFRRAAKSVAGLGRFMV